MIRSFKKLAELKEVVKSKVCHSVISKRKDSYDRGKESSKRYTLNTVHFGEVNE